MLRKTLRRFLLLLRNVYPAGCGEVVWLFTFCISMYSNSVDVVNAIMIARPVPVHIYWIGLTNWF